MQPKNWVLTGIILIATGAGQMVAEPIGNFQQTILTTVINNPEVTASWYTFLEASEEQKVASGRYLPKVDLLAEYGRETKENPLAPKDTYNRDSARLILTQMLFDGFETKHEVSRLAYNRLARYHELRSVTEQVAQEATQAYFDVLRYQKLVALSEQNYVQHKLVFDNIEERVSAGIGRRVDLEQANGRLALAESNLLTEITNLHDVSVRFLRIVGQVPAETLMPPALPTTLIPSSSNETLLQAYARSPILAAATHTLLAAQAELKTKNASMYPRLDLRIRESLDHDSNGVVGQYDERAIELVMSYNLYNGGSDRAKKKQYYQRLNSVRERRVKACRDVRQTASIAYNDIQSLTQQLVYLDRNRQAITKARLAYRKQYDIGQRTLLDLLDTENEYFEVHRSYVNSEHDLLSAQSRTLASMGLLLAAVGVEGLDSKALKEIDWKGNENEKDLLSCPIESITIKPRDKKALLKKTVSDKRLRQRSDGRVSFTMDVKFNYASANIQEAFSKDIDDAVKLLNTQPNVKGIIEGHADSAGTDDFNIKLSKARANAVMQAIVKKGISQNRLTAIGYGEFKPIGDNSKAEGRAKNRRVELVMQATLNSGPLKLADFAIN